MIDYQKTRKEYLLEPEKIPVYLPWKLFWSSLLILGLVLVLYFSLEFGYKSFLNSELKSVEKRITELEKRITSEQRENLINFYSQLVNVQELFRNHIKPSNLFSFLEQNILKEVYLTKIDADLKQHYLTLEGIALSYKNLAQQILVFKQNPLIKQVVLNESEKGEEGITFSTMILFNEQLFKFE